jgi:hypothetical protein
MEKMWAVFLSRLSSPDHDFTYDDVSEWSQEEFDDLNRAGLIAEMASATHVVCNACPEAHWERVLWSEDGKRASIPCPANGIVHVPPERLRTWRCSPAKFATGLAKWLDLAGDVQSLPTSPLWFVGRRRVAGNNPYFFFAAICPEQVSAAIKEIRAVYGRVTRVLLVPFAPVDGTEDGKLKIIDVRRAVSLQGRTINGDVEFIEAQFTDERRTVKSQPQAKKPGGLLKAHRRRILKAAMTDKHLDGMDALARHMGVSETALNGMARGDKTRYGDNKLAAALSRINCTPAKWNRIPKPAAR